MELLLFLCAQKIIAPQLWMQLLFPKYLGAFQHELPNYRYSEKTLGKPVQPVLSLVPGYCRKLSQRREKRDWAALYLKTWSLA